MPAEPAYTMKTSDPALMRGRDVCGDQTAVQHIHYCTLSPGHAGSHRGGGMAWGTITPPAAEPEARDADPLWNDIEPTLKMRLRGIDTRLEALERFREGHLAGHARRASHPAPSPSAEEPCNAFEEALWNFPCDAPGPHGYRCTKIRGHDGLHEVRALWAESPRPAPPAAGDEQPVGSILCGSPACPGRALVWPNGEAVCSCGWTSYTGLRPSAPPAAGDEQPSLAARISELKKKHRDAPDLDPRLRAMLARIEGLEFKAGW